MKEIKYEDIANSKLLQAQITNLLAERFSTCKLTLSEIGYFHMCSVIFNGKNIETKLYFHPELALRQTKSFNGNVKYNIREQFEQVMKNYFFVGNINDVISIEMVGVPKYKIKNSEYGKSLLIKDKIDESTEEVVTITCNIDLILAAINNISLFDNYHIKYNSIGSNKKKKPIMISASSEMYPIEIDIEWDDNNISYNPNDAEAYIMQIVNNKRKEKMVEKKIAKKASETKVKISKLYNSYNKYR